MLLIFSINLVKFKDGSTYLGTEKVSEIFDRPQNMIRLEVAESAEDDVQRRIQEIFKGG